jgi:hypothetical protein
VEGTFVIDLNNSNGHRRPPARSRRGDNIVDTSYRAAAPCRALRLRLDGRRALFNAVQTHVEQHPELRHPMQKLPHEYVSTAANFVAKVTPRIPRRKRIAAH